MTTNESFASLFEQSVGRLDLKPGAIVTATIEAITPERVVVNAGLKSEGIIPRDEFKNEEISVGDQIEVVIRAIENGFGETRLSYEDAKRAKSWAKLEQELNAGNHVMGTITDRVKGGFTVLVDGLQAFLPGSLIDVKPVRDPGYLESKELEFRIIKMDKRRNNIVVSRRAVLEQENSEEREQRMAELDEGSEVKGIVKNITDYGAFVDLGGIDGLLHITDMAWKRVKHPGELLNVGDEINVKILKFDRDKNRVSLGLKQMGEDPWGNIARRYQVGTRMHGHVTNITDYGCFVEIESGVEGLVHMSEMDWTNKNIHPSKVVEPGQEVEVEVLEINEDRRRISLGMKQCKANPWEEFASSHKEGDKVSGEVRSITDFGVFIGLDGNIDGLVHLSDLSWTEPGDVAVRGFKRGDQVEAVILGVDPERERISLGVKQLSNDPIGKFIEDNNGNVITGKVIEVDAKRALLDLGNDVVGHLRVPEYSFDRISDLSKELEVGTELEVKLIDGERRGRELPVSHKATLRDTVEKVKAKISEAPANTTLGDLLKEQMGSEDN